LECGATTGRFYSHQNFWGKTLLPETLPETLLPETLLNSRIVKLH